MSLYTFAKNVVAAILYPVYRIKVVGAENVPDKGPVIICSNHISNFDPPVVGITSPRDIYFMAKEELFNNTFLRGLLTRLHAFPIKRGMKDRNALRQALNILEEGNTLGLFPEGTRNKTGKVGKGLAGAGFFALRSQAYIVPCAIIGPYKPFKQLKVVYGKPIEMEQYRENKVSAKDVTQVIMQEIQKLIDENR
ncbi:1-acyl-sn-glycerol-3-phosphate acyltransferase [Sediminibacillus dalangtanensis]|uniref:1-acyl-sn-glycerol-3-phosphate acyltransferase n=1 Tax=Sediminibacillus dalangtanensis TaxID=2729421 RepID=A0ABX7VZ33_9BACI|nr:lysophospholipid acyltransferase family protein [Sediminibacillus dalangtanensis]QTM99672.1 1-acyl-sn-glycerol-3-phosphate acyltransferase [Sediminibacillus dalangtanensis]